MNHPEDRTDLQEMLGRIKSLEPFPSVAIKVLSMSTQEDVLPRDLIGVIETDAAVTAKVLKLCNSAYYGFRREIASLHEAGNMLGVRTLVDLVMTSCTARYFQRAGGSDVSTQSLWKRSVTNAWAAQHLAQAGRGVDANRAYTVGLLQDIGHLVADRHIRDRWADIQAQVAAGADLLRAEEEVLGMNHAEVGAHLAYQWDLPDVLVDSIRCHHAPESATAEPELAWYAHLADAVTVAFASHEAETGDSEEPVDYGMSPDALSVTGFTQTELDSVEGLLRDAVATAQEFIEV